MRWLSQDIYLTLFLTTMAFFAVMGLVGVVLALDSLRSSAYLGLSWGESIMILLGVTFVLVAFRLSFRLRFYENSAPSFDVGEAGVLVNLLRLRVRNTSQISVGVSARAKVDDGNMSTEEFVLQWEETKENILQINPGDYGTLRIGESLAIAPDGILMHMVNLFSWRQGTEVEFTWGHHPEKSEPVDFPFTLWLYPDRPARSEYRWNYRLSDHHPGSRFFLTELPVKPSRVSRLKGKVRRGIKRIRGI